MSTAYELIMEMMTAFEARIDARDREFDQQVAEEKENLEKWMQQMDDLRRENDAKSEQHAMAALERGHRMIALLEQIARDSAAIRTMLSIVYFAKNEDGQK